MTYKPASREWRGYSRAALIGLLLLPGLAVARSPPPTLVLPVSSPCISSPFGPRIIPNHPQAGTYHYGVDLPAPEGAEVRATAFGKVIGIHNSGPGGLEILVQHEGYVGVYSHLGMVTPALAVGRTTVMAGDKLGVVGHTGVVFGTHLYFGMIAGRPIDPAPYLGVPLCAGAVHQRTPAEILESGGKLPPTRHYYLLDQFPYK